MIDDFKTDLIVRVAGQARDNILRSMGYGKPTQAQFERLQVVLDDPEFGLGQSHFDFKYSSDNFLRALCVAVGINAKVADARIQKIRSRLEEERQAFKPFIWVDTGFVRKSQPIFALAVCEHQRYLHFPEDFWRLSIDEQLGVAKCRVQEHVYENGRELGIWGEIKQYWFYYEKDAAYLLSLNGEVISRHEGPVANQATGGRELDVVSRGIRRNNE
ncbi:hypothetical protein FWJ25_11120 [Marinobacter salinexigens]|uniref:Uncharacterized protein n=1 Tax=Marinobacter salinexigens TaxID=2919747 RepID=A0A5B0VH31_9GAMM|nr:hypothetical protein [Marinobacter salinexigens]KAA1173950.1 hypothetical protein FWJ25_11120 [Marinobacter salinexigens]